MRTAVVERNTKETEISLELNVDGKGDYEIETPIGFLTHMLEGFSKWGTFDVNMKVKGDVEVDQHHTVEDTGIVLGQAFDQALGDRRGINRAGFFAFPMAAKMAFLVLGPMVDLKLIAVYTTMFRPKAILAISGLTTLLVFVLCATGYFWMPALGAAIGGAF